MISNDKDMQCRAVMRSRASDEQLKQHIDAQADMLMHPNTVTHIHTLVDKYLQQQGEAMSRQTIARSA